MFHVYCHLHVCNCDIDFDIVLYNVNENNCINLHGVLHTQEKRQSVLDTFKCLMSQAAEHPPCTLRGG